MKKPDENEMKGKVIIFQHNNQTDMDFAKEKAKRCKYFSWSPLGTALYCNKKKIELKSVFHGKEWTGEECLKCSKWRLKENEE